MTRGLFLPERREIRDLYDFLALTHQKLRREAEFGEHHFLECNKEVISFVWEQHLHTATRWWWISSQSEKLHERAACFLRWACFTSQMEVIWSCWTAAHSVKELYQHYFVRLISQTVLESTFEFVYICIIYLLQQLFVNIKIYVETLSRFLWLASGCHLCDSVAIN